MKHNTKVTLIIVGMFIVTQLLGIYVVNHYISHELPLGFGVPHTQDQGEYSQALASLVIAFIIAISLVFFLSKFKVEFVLRAWFFVVVAIALTLTLNAFINAENFPLKSYTFAFILLIAIILAYIKIYRRDYLTHNLTELLVYPGIAAIFVQFLNVITLVILLIIISIYDMWAVWHSGIMQKMAKYQINKLNVFSGFFIPYMTKNLKMKIQKMKKSELKKKKIRVNVAMLGGGDVVFPIIASGVVLKTFGLIPALFVTLGATIGLTYLLIFSEKKKFYPAMPFITAGILAAILLAYLLQ